MYNKPALEAFIATAAGYVLCKCENIHYERNADPQDAYPVPRSITVSLKNEMGKIVQMKRPLPSFSLLEIADGDIENSTDNAL